MGATQSEVSSLAFSVPMKKIPDDEMSLSGRCINVSLITCSHSVSRCIRESLCASPINWNYLYQSLHPQPPLLSEEDPPPPPKIRTSLATPSFRRPLQIAIISPPPSSGLIFDNTNSFIIT